ncbi:ferritin [Virgibacillus sp. C22-A2]|uniref:Ferritin n=1 Tax=Virgibacillus tibetensis TaxID=3042313 RepID=A0ABU6KHZ6_9BACI|nr:ferritin [Virgibacillus sp. C22-A2]
MMTNKLKEALVNQMNDEFAAAHEYMAMAAYCEANSYNGFANFYIQQAKEERFHGMKIYNFLNDRGVHAKFKALPAPTNDYDSVLDTFKKGLKQEQGVTKSFYNISDIATEEREHMTLSFVRWFLDEQVEEESMFETHIDYIERIKDDNNALYIYEQELAKRQFNEDV